MTSNGTSAFEKVVRVLERHLSSIHARSLLQKALAEHRLTPQQFKIADLATINGSLIRSMRLFASDLVSNRAIADLADLHDAKTTSIEPCTIEIEAESDISRARTAARQMCEQAGVTGFPVQKAATIVSELARNIISYTPGGRVELAWQNQTRQRMVIRAIDRGPGIPNLAHVMSGEYQSKTGLGRGLFGTKRLADRFDITTGPDGTNVLVEIYF